MSDEKPERLSKYWAPEEPSPLRTREVKDWVEEQIQEAMARGTFNNLPGKGKPLQLDSEHPWEQKDWMANHVLSNAKYVPEWVMLEQEINAELQWLRENREHAERAERVGALNRKIDRFNLLVPAGFMQKPRLPQ